MILWLLAGCATGIIAGLIPGLHSNNFSALLAVSPIFGMDAVVFTLSMCVTQSFTEFIPSIFLSAPSTDTFESILPGHRMLLEGKGFEAICSAAFGGMVAIILGAILTPLFFTYIQQNSAEIITITPIVLIAALLSIALENKNKRKIVTNIFIIFAAATQGILFQEQILALITGYFGLSAVLYSLKEEIVCKKQSFEATIGVCELKEALVGMCGGAIVSVMPGIGSNTAAGILRTLRKSKTQKGYLSMLGAISVSNFFFSFATLFAIDKTRNGAMISIQDKIFFTQNELFYGTIIMVIAGMIGAISVILISKKASELFSPGMEKALSAASGIIMILVVALLLGTGGIIALFFSTALGLFVLSTKSKRSATMSALIVPALFFYVFILI